MAKPLSKTTRGVVHDMDDKRGMHLKDESGKIVDDFEILEPFVGQYVEVTVTVVGRLVCPDCKGPMTEEEKGLWLCQRCKLAAARKGVK